METDSSRDGWQPNCIFRAWETEPGYPPKVLQPTLRQGSLPVIAADPSDAIFDGIDAQLGATWFDSRIVQFDCRRGALRVLETTPTGTLGRAVFTLDSGDDVFEGEDVLAKVGPTAYGRVTLTLDYRDRVAYFD
jgi:hypothetical protein